MENREYLQKFCTEAELLEFFSIKQRIQSAEQAIHPAAVPDNVPEEQALRLFRAALELKADMRLAEQSWWLKILAKYSLPAVVSIDPKTREFYRIIPA